MSKARPILALIAAYALALQALLLPLSVAAAPFADGLCAAAQTNGAAPSHTIGCPCAAGCGMCCSTALAEPPTAGGVPIALSSQINAPEPVLIATSRTVGRSPQNSTRPACRLTTTLSLAF